jgi:hypothetical protein
VTHSATGARPLFSTRDELKPFLALCREGRLYEVERWLADGRPAQLDPEAIRRGYRPPSALEVVIETGQHSLMLLLLKSGYRLDLERHNPLNRALKQRRLDLAICREEFGGVRMRWVDGKGHPLETKLDSFLAGLGDAARAKRAWREAKQEQERQWQERRRKEEEAESRRWETRARAEKLDRQVNDWNRSRLIRQYVQDMRANALATEKWNVDGIPLVQWMDWALAYADSIDPVAPIRKAGSTP